MSVSVVFLAPEPGPEGSSALGPGPESFGGSGGPVPAGRGARSASSGGSGGSGGSARQGGLRLTRSASEALVRLGVDAAVVAQVMADPDEVRPDRDRPERTRFVRGRYTVVAGRDGAVLAVYRR